MRRAEEMAAGADIADRLERQRLVGYIERLEELGNHLQEVDVEDEFFERRGQAALRPAGRMHDEIAAAFDNAPKREDRLVSRLRVDRVGGVGVGRAVGEAVAT